MTDWNICALVDFNFDFLKLYTSGQLFLGAEILKCKKPTFSAHSPTHNVPPLKFCTHIGIFLFVMIIIDRLQLLLIIWVYERQCNCYRNDSIFGIMWIDAIFCWLTYSVSLITCRFRASIVCLVLSLWIFKIQIKILCLLWISFLWRIAHMPYKYFFSLPFETYLTQKQRQLALSL